MKPVLRLGALPVGLAVLGVTELVIMRWDGWAYGVALECIACLLLVARQAFPLAACTGAAVVMLTMPWFGPQLDEPAAPIAILFVIAFSLARWIADLRGLIGIAAVTLMLLLAYVLVDGREHNASDIIFVTVLLAPPYILGRVTRKLAEQADQLRQQQELIKAEAVRAERARIARELHDIMAHSVSAMVVQTAAAQDLVRADPDRAIETLHDVANTGRKALTETRRLLHLIRDEADELGLNPTPGLDRLPELVAAFRDSGLRIDLEINGPMSPLPAGIDMSAYRIVQEALTNALKYADDRRTSLVLSRSPTCLSIATDNHRAFSDATGSGLGLVGMAERTSVFGGSLTHGMTDDGRFVLMDIRMLVLDGIAATRELTALGVAARVLILTTYDLDHYVYEALRAGATGFLLKATPPDRLADGIGIVAQGESLLASSLTRRLIEEHVHRPPPTAGKPPALRQLTERELEVFALIGRGRSNDEIATELIVAPSTVHRQESCQSDPRQTRLHHPSASRGAGLRIRTRPPRRPRGLMN